MFIKIITLSNSWCSGIKRKEVREVFTFPARVTGLNGTETNLLWFLQHQHHFVLDPDPLSLQHLEDHLKHNSRQIKAMVQSYKKYDKCYNSVRYIYIYIYN